MILLGFFVFFMIIALTIVFGGISHLGDKRVAREGRPTKDQRLPGQREALLAQEQDARAW
jgi:hypothetical protein